MVTAALAAVLVSQVAAGCTATDRLLGDDEPPLLEPIWTIAGGVDKNPQHTGSHHWINMNVIRNGVGWTSTYSPGALFMVDARTGETSGRRLPGDGWSCGLPRTISPSGLVVVMLPSGTSGANACNRFLALDATTGETLWRRNGVDLTPVALPRRNRHSVLGADDEVVALARVGGAAVCLDAETGEPVDGDDVACHDLADRLTHADLPPLMDPDGDRVPFSADDTSDTEELGRTDDVLLVRTLIPDSSPDGASAVVRAHDLGTGETLWEDADLASDPHGDSSTWNRHETYFVAPSGIARVTYDHVDGPTEDPETDEAAGAEPDYDLTEPMVSDEELATTPMVITAVDPRTGEDLGEVASMEGAWFARQFGDVTVALTDQELKLRATISGFRLPTW